MPVVSLGGGASTVIWATESEDIASMMLTECGARKIF